VCGRYASYRAAQDLADAFDVAEVTPEAAAVPPSYNVAPTMSIRIVLERRERLDEGAGAETSQPGSVPGGGPRMRRELHAARWGLVPAWASDLRIGNRLINARVESLAEKPAFRASLARRRCVVPAEGYYEWERRDGTKVPYFIHDSGGAPLALAGLYAFWRDPERADDDPERWILSATILTRSAAPGLARIHDRQPVVLEPDDLSAWLDPTIEDAREVVSHLLGPGAPLAYHEVSRRVNRAGIDDPGLILPV
jgi:putative SOS response-associated peptidase YedK